MIGALIQPVATSKSNVKEAVALDNIRSRLHEFPHLEGRLANAPGPQGLKCGLRRAICIEEFSFCHVIVDVSKVPVHG